MFQHIPVQTKYITNIRSLKQKGGTQHAKMAGDGGTYNKMTGKMRVYNNNKVRMKENECHDKECNEKQ